MRRISLPTILTSFLDRDERLHLHPRWFHPLQLAPVVFFLPPTGADIGLTLGQLALWGGYILSMEKPTGGKVQEQGGVFSDSVTTQSTFTAFKTHFGYTFTIPRSGNILMRHCFHGFSIY